MRAFVLLCIVGCALAQYGQSSGRRGYNQRNQAQNNNKAVKKTGYYGGEYYDEYNYDKDYYGDDYYGDDYYGDYYGNDYNNGGRNMQKSEKSGGYGSHHGSHGTNYVPVVVSHKKKSNFNFIEVSEGFYLPGGSKLFGKFEDLQSCQKACDLSSICFGGDYNRVTKQCYAHGNRTMCSNVAKEQHDQLVHFSKVPCMVPETPRTWITLGVMQFGGLKLSHVKSLAECIKECVTMGGGIAAKFDEIGSTPQICFGINYDFEGQTCFARIEYVTSLVDKGVQSFCKKNAAMFQPKTHYPNPSSVAMSFCPISKT